MYSNYWRDKRVGTPDANNDELLQQITRPNE